MEWPEDLTSALPAPRDDEPHDLRRKIIAELQDHLHGAMQREVLSTGDAEQARRNVIARFGDPVRVARKLWLDAMWGKIMTQRLLLVTLVVVLLISVGSMGMTWMLIVHAGQVNQALLEQNRAANEMMLAKLTTIGNAPGSSGKSMEWNSLKVKLSVDKPGGAPMSGAEVSLFGHLIETGNIATLARTTGADGVADFGLVRIGQFQISVVTPSGEVIDDRDMRFFGRLVTVLPGESQSMEIVCPSKLEEAEITMTVDWPSELAGQPLWLVCDLVRRPRKVGGRWWKRNINDERQFAIIDPFGKLSDPEMLASEGGMIRNSESFFDSNTGVGMVEDEQRFFVVDQKSYADSPGIYSFVSPKTKSEFPATRKVSSVHIWLPKAAAVSRFKWPAGKYSMGHIAIGRESETDEKSLPDNLLHPVFLGGIKFEDDYNNTANSPMTVIYADLEQATARPINRTTAKHEAPKFEAVAGRLNEWRLSLPKPLVEILIEPETKSKDAPQ